MSTLVWGKLFPGFKLKWENRIDRWRSRGKIKMRINANKWDVYLPLWFSSSSFLFALYCGEKAILQVHRASTPTTLALINFWDLCHTLLRSNFFLIIVNGQVIWSLGYLILLILPFRYYALGWLNALGILSKGKWIGYLHLMFSFYFKGKNQVIAVINALMLQWGQKRNPLQTGKYI